MTNEKILLQLEKGYDITNPQLAQALSNLETKISEGGGGTDIPEELVSYLQNLNDKIYVCNSTDVVNQSLSSEVVNAIMESAAIIFNDMKILLVKGASSSIGPTFVAPLDSTNLRSWQLNILTNFGESINITPYNVANVVLYTPQTLGTTQKAQVRTNIDVLSPDELLNSTNFISKLRTKLGLDVEN